MIKQTYFSTFAFTIFLIFLFSSCKLNSNEKRVEESNSKHQIISSLSTSESNSKKLVKSIIESDNEDYLYVYILDPNKTGTTIRNKPNGKSVLKMFQKNEEDIHFVTVIKSENGWFKISGAVQGNAENDTIEIPGGEGWIHGSFLFADTKNNEADHLQLLEKPKKGSPPVYEFKESYSRVSLLEMFGNWVKVKFNGKAGWVESKWLCGYYFTTCS